MNCPFCKAFKSHVVDTRHVIDGDTEYVRRRRKCPVCKERWSTYETLELPTDYEESVRKLKEIRRVLNE